HGACTARRRAADRGRGAARAVEVAGDPGGAGGVRHGQLAGAAPAGLNRNTMSSSLRVHDTRLKRKVPFEPREPGKIGMYVCGITVYDLCHVGHARFLVAFDVIARYLRHRGLAVKLVRNITDVDDKIIRRAQKEGRSAAEVAETYIQAMQEDFRALGLQTPDVEPRATLHIQEVIDVVSR